MSSSTNQELDPAAEQAAREKEAAEQAALPYQWQQTLRDVSITVPVPVGTRGRDLIVEIGHKRLKVSLKGKEPIMEGDLSKPIRTDESTWTLEDQKSIEIHLEKINQMEWWANVLTHHPPIDTSKITPENSKISDLEGETQAMVRKILWEQEQQRQLKAAGGRESVENTAQQKLLEKLKMQNPDFDFSNAEGA
ncbi:hypothetical protein RUND412_005015 [Rhizina undulata]